MLCRAMNIDRSYEMTEAIKNSKMLQSIMTANWTYELLRCYHFI